jgi:putative PIN family toxin of toxin-antitoxin system
MRIILDTNVLVSGIVYPKSVPGRIIQAWHSDRVSIVMSEYILDEMERVLPGLKQCTLSGSEIAQLRELFYFKAEMVELEVIEEAALTDKNDLPILAALLTSGAEVLVTGDKALLKLSDDYPIVTAADFWNRWGI